MPEGKEDFFVLKGLLNTSLRQPQNADAAIAIVHVIRAKRESS
jgi:hypothetical protein